ncbi:MAG: dihydroneopterin aldolase [Marinomonas sp.]|nr:MAG: dihydroneopterin aldolase [Marinomonas sp.]
MQDIVFIEGLHTKAVIGVYDWEKVIWQDLVFDVEMVPAANDDINKTLDYEAISNAITGFCKEHQFELIETLAERLCAVLIDRFGLTSITMTLRKPGAVPAARAVGVKIRRSA